MFSFKWHLTLEWFRYHFHRYFQPKSYTFFSNNYIKQITALSFFSLFFLYLSKYSSKRNKLYSNMTSFVHFVNKPVMYFFINSHLHMSGPHI